MTDPCPELVEIHDALASLNRLGSKGLAVRYAEMWLNEAATSSDRTTLRANLDRAEQQLGVALLASAAPSLELSLAYSLTQRARSEATD